MARLLFFALACFLFAGCGLSGPPKAKVKGEVSIDGEPVATGAIAFSPVDGKTPTSGATIADGKYETEIYVGQMDVRINYPKITGKKKAYDAPDSPLIPITTEIMPEKYHAKTELKAEVKSGENTIDFKLKSK